MQMVAEHTKVPVPKVLWLETGTDAIGVPFFVMERVDGVVPPDVLPYTFGDNWFFDADVEDQQRLERQAVETVAALHELTGRRTGPVPGRARPTARATCATMSTSSGPTTTGSAQTGSVRRSSSVDSNGSRSTGPSRPTTPCSAGETPASAT